MNITKSKSFKNRWVTALLVTLALPVFLTACSAADTDAGTAAPIASESSTEAAKPAKPAEKVPAEYEAALKQADTYANAMNMSKQAIYDQLTAESGGKFKKDAADYAMAHVHANWNKNALESAKIMQKDMAMSTAAIKDQLTSKYGNKFTASQAAYAMAHLDD